MTNMVSDEVLAELADVILRISRELDPHGAKAIDIATLNGTEALVLRWVWNQEGTTPGATAEAIAVQSSNVSTALRSLTAKGLVERRPDELDARVVRLYLTELAHGTMHRVHNHWAGRLRGALGDDDGAYVQRAVELLIRLDWQLRTEAEPDMGAVQPERPDQAQT